MTVSPNRSVFIPWAATEPLANTSSFPAIVTELCSLQLKGPKSFPTKPSSLSIPLQKQESKLSRFFTRMPTDMRQQDNPALWCRAALNLSYHSHSWLQAPGKPSSPGAGSSLQQQAQLEANKAVWLLGTIPRVKPQITGPIFIPFHVFPKGTSRKSKLLQHRKGLFPLLIKFTDSPTNPSWLSTQMPQGYDYIRGRESSGFSMSSHP